MPYLNDGLLRRASDRLDLASIPVQGDATRKAAARRILRSFLGAGALFPGDHESVNSEYLAYVELATSRWAIIRARSARIGLVAFTATAVGMVAPVAVRIVQSEYTNMPSTEVEQTNNPDLPQPLPEPSTPTSPPTQLAQ